MTCPPFFWGGVSGMQAPQLCLHHHWQEVWIKLIPFSLIPSCFVLFSVGTCAREIIVFCCRPFLRFLFLRLERALLLQETTPKLFGSIPFLKLQRSRSRRSRKKRKKEREKRGRFWLQVHMAYSVFLIVCWHGHVLNCFFFKL